MYDDFVRDKNSVDPAWRDFFEDYRPGERASDVAPSTPDDTQETAPDAPETGDAQPGASAQSGGADTPTPVAKPSPTHPAKPTQQPAAPAANTDATALA